MDQHPPSNTGKHTALWVLLSIIITAIATTLLLNSQLFANRFTPVELDTQEQDTLSSKLATMGLTDLRVGDSNQDDMAPEPYREADGNREISLNEREVNAIINQNTDMGEKLVLDFSQNLMSAKLLFPLDPELPFIGGKTLRASSGISLSLVNGEPSVILKGVSIWGVPVPNAWLGGLKNVDLVHEFGDAGFWKSFADGIESIEVREGALQLKLQE